MEPIDVIVQALLAGAAAGAKDTCSKVVKDTYEGLKSLLKGRFKGKNKAEGGLILGKIEEKPKVWEAPLKDCLDEIGADRDINIIEAAKNMLNLLHQEGATKEIFAGDFREAEGPVQAKEIGSITQFFGDKSKDKAGRGVQRKKTRGGSGHSGTSEGKQDFGLPNNLNLSQEETDCMLWMAVKPEVKYPICHHRAVTHASGTAIAGLVTKALSRKISILINRFRNCGRQLARCESEPCVERVDEYALELAGLKQDLEKIARRACSGGSNGGTIIGEVFAKLDGGNKILCGEILEVLSDCRTLLDTLESLKSQVPAEDTGDCSDEIRGRFVENGVAIEEIGDRLGNVVKDILKLESKVKLDWDKDQDVIWGPRCRPRPEEYRECRCQD